jgi:type IV fimbrial biogenesis protein FimT
MTRWQAAGFSLIELLISMSIAAILMLFALPSYTRWVADTEISDTASLIADGLRYTHAEAIKRNTNVEFVVNPTTGTGGWGVQLPAGPTLRMDLLAQGGKRAVVTPVPAGLRTITFNGVGGVEAVNADASAPFGWIDVTVPNGTRPLRVLIHNNRSVKVCDPTFAWPDPKGCPP